MNNLNKTLELSNKLWWPVWNAYRHDYINSREALDKGFEICNQIKKELDPRNEDQMSREKFDEGIQYRYILCDPPGKLAVEEFANLVFGWW